METMRRIGMGSLTPFQTYAVRGPSIVDPFGFREHAPPESPIWTSDSRIVRLSCPRHNEFATRADPLTPSEKASSRETGFEEIQSACGSQGFHFPPSEL